MPTAAARGIESAAAAIVALLFCAGMLRSEVAALRWQDVELTSTPGQVRVRTAKTNPAAEREDYRLTINGFGAP